MRSVLCSVVCAAALALAGCGGGDSTTVVSHVTTVTSTPSTVTETTSTQSNAPLTLLPSPALNKSYKKPSTYALSADGDLVAEGLTWSGWGAPSAQASGTFNFRELPSNKRTSLPGTITASALESCNSVQYYTRIQVHVPASAPFQPQTPPLQTPC